MRELLTIVHSTTGDLTTGDFDNSGWLRWNTCMRQMAIGFECQKPEGCITFSGSEAYQFFLEVVSGLHSPIIGETEVMGQFRELFDVTTKSTHKNKSQFLSFFKNILTDAKQVRAVALKDLGSRSYGSLLRKYLKESHSVGIFGAGKLVKEILPWLKPQERLTVKCRRTEQGQKLKEKFNFIQVEDLHAPFSGDTLIIAAPMTSEEIRSQLIGAQGVQKIIDLRENSSRDPLNMNIPTLPLAQLFREIETTEKDVELKVAKAKILIKELSHKWIFVAENRPFGWEDLCG